MSAKDTPAPRIRLVANLVWLAVGLLVCWLGYHFVPRMNAVSILSFCVAAAGLRIGSGLSEIAKAIRTSASAHDTRRHVVLASARSETDPALRGVGSGADSCEARAQ